MKLNIQRAGLAVLLTLPLALVVVGCKDKTTASTDSAPLRDRASASDRGNDRSYARTNAAMAEADNTRINVRDRSDVTLTAGDQGTTPADRDITQKIRKGLVIDASGYSVTAKNIKIITVNGKVTLRGPVNTDAEKTGIVTLAQSVAGAGNVEDQLEVKANP